jgi:hypothetical protein
VPQVNKKFELLASQRQSVARENEKSVRGNKKGVWQGGGTRSETNPDLGGKRASLSREESGFAFAFAP